MNKAKKLVIVESPAKAATIKKYLGEDFIVMSSIGHICELASGGKFGIGIDIDNKFKPHYHLIKDKITLLDEIIRIAEKSEIILLATDDDREGEAISFHLSRYLSSINKPIKRIKFNEITKSSILKAVNNLQDIDTNLVRAQEARRILDRIVGFMVSPFLINYYGPNLSAGRVQSVAVRMIVDRERDIDKFKPEEYWNIHAKFATHNGETFETKANTRPKNKESTDSYLEALKKQEEFYVTSVSAQKKKEKPCPPLTTVTLQQYMAKKFSMEPEKTMKIAQNLYENGYCTYIRTDSTRISEEAIESVRIWIKEHYDLPEKPNLYTTKDSAQDAHECIRPTNINTLPDSSILTGDERNVYRAIWQHFIACQMNPAIWSTMHVNICARHNQKISFSVSGKALDYKGYLEIFGDIDPGKIDIPNLHENDILTLVGDVKSEQKFTKPPPRYNDASIVEELDSKQIGRPATYAEIIKKIASRNYVEKQGSTYRPTELGKKITTILVDLFPFMEYKYTAEMEKKLDDIASGSLDHLNMLKDFFGPFKEQLRQAYIGNGSSVCDKCGSPMILRINSKDQTKFLACSGYPKCRNTKTVS